MSVLIGTKQRGTSNTPQEKLLLRRLKHLAILVANAAQTRVYRKLSKERARWLLMALGYHHKAHSSSAVCLDKAAMRRACGLERWPGELQTTTGEDDKHMTGPRGGFLKSFCWEMCESVHTVLEPQLPEEEGTLKDVTPARLVFSRHQHQITVDKHQKVPPPPACGCDPEACWVGYNLAAVKEKDGKAVYCLLYIT
ncbi:hypothetical protein EYF80_016025 [Liparis tanakae]|uniref:Uncharacterized protein n=1 Tax=Liparis tanakae TaxID=230148 RepID=A0A4Z2I6Z8_9TELE|nr:hypothetical protein EYF80_016025 [Liparis tanakae]